MIKFTTFNLVTLMGLACCATGSDYFPPSMDGNFYFSLERTEYDRNCEDAQNVVIENHNKYALKNDKNIVVGESVFLISDYRACIKRDGLINLALNLYANPDNPVSLVSGVCAKVDQDMNLVSWKPYC